MSSVEVVDIAPSGARRKTMSVREMCEEYTPPDWLIPGLLERGQHAFLFGESGVGKSAIMVDICLRLAACMPVHGVSANGGRPVGVLYLANEGRGGIKRRVPAWVQRQGYDLAEPPDLPMALLDEQVLVDEEGVADLLATLAAFPEIYGVPCELCVVDTMASSFTGESENSATDITRHVNLLNLIAQTGPAIVEVHHSGHANKERMRGSSALKGAVDAELRATLISEGSKLVLLETTKVKDGAGLGRLGYRLVEHELQGELGPTGITAVVAEEVTLQRDLPPQAHRAWAVLEDLHNEQRAMLNDPGVHDGLVLRRTWIDACIERGVIASSDRANQVSQMSRVITILRRAAVIEEISEAYRPLYAEPQEAEE